MLDSIFFTQLFVSERKQIAFMAEEKSPSRISLRLFATKRSEMRISMNKKDTDCHKESSLDMAVMLELQENDRSRIARDLHDITIQELVHIIQMTELCMKCLDDPTRVKLELASIIQSLRDAIDDTRNIIYDLRPMSFDDIGFTEALIHMADDAMLITDFQIETDIDDFKKCNLYKDHFISLYRIIVELVRNALYHSKGNKIKISVKKIDGVICVHVIDNGTGFDPNTSGKKTSFGLQIVKNRLDLLNGKMRIKSNSNGTDIEIVITDWENTYD